MHFPIMKIGGKLGKTQYQKKNTTQLLVGGGGHGLATAYYLAKKHEYEKYCRCRKRLDWWW
jgi:ribulose 1,5-bisphosphate synthetase/thiazole synthase